MVEALADPSDNALHEGVGWLVHAGIVATALAALSAAPPPPPSQPAGTGSASPISCV